MNNLDHPSSLFFFFNIPLNIRGIVFVCEEGARFAVNTIFITLRSSGSKISFALRGWNWGGLARTSSMFHDQLSFSTGI